MSPKRKRRKTDEAEASGKDIDIGDHSDNFGHQLLHAGKSKDLLIKLLKVEPCNLYLILDIQGCERLKL